MFFVRCVTKMKRKTQVASVRINHFQDPEATIINLNSDSSHADLRVLPGLKHGTKRREILSALSSMTEPEK